MFVPLLIVSSLVGAIFSDENVLCTATYCNDVKCPGLSPKCTAQNATHNGVFVLSPSTCNCCQHCLDNLDEGVECSTGDVSNPVPTEICGPGLYCKPNSEDDIDGVCSRMNTNCTKLQDDYDQRKGNGSLGTMEVRQDCNSEGEFVSYKCVPGQTCYCVNSKGKRIFGESDFTSLPAVEIKCQCSRIYDEIANVMGRELSPVEHFHCAANGDYETVQCIGEQCLCVDAEDGAPTYPDDPMVNLTDISTLKCYNKEEPDLFYKKCEEEYIEVLKEYLEVKNKGFSMIFGFEYPKCDFDGTYQAVQENQTHKYCVDKEGAVLTAVDKVVDATLADSMDCKCARASLIMTTNEKPECLENGNYAPKQCRRGRCRCVDNDGNQVCKDANCELDDVDVLTC